MLPWRTLATSSAPDGSPIVLRRRGQEYLIVADGYDLMSTADKESSEALAKLGCAHIDPSCSARILVGGLGMGFTLRAALDQITQNSTVEVAELILAVAQWNRGELAEVANHPLDDPRTKLSIEDVSAAIQRSNKLFDAILIDVDNGPDALAHSDNAKLYNSQGLVHAWRALRPICGVLAVWSYSDDKTFSNRLRKQGFNVVIHRVPASRTGRGRYHIVWIATRPH